MNNIITLKLIKGKGLTDLNRKTVVLMKDQVEAKTALLKADGWKVISERGGVY